MAFFQDKRNPPERVGSISDHTSVAYDCIRVVAIFQIVFNHATDLLWTEPQMTWRWLFIDGIQTVTRTSLALLLLLSGALLLGKKAADAPFLFYWKRMRRIILPFLSYSIFYYLYKNRTQSSVQGFIDTFLAGGTEYHLWFMYMLIGLYIATPILSMLLQGISQDNFKKALTGLFILNCLHYYIQFFWPQIHSPVTICFFSGWMCFFICGAYMRQIEGVFSFWKLIAAFIPLYGITFFHRFWFSGDIYYFSLNMVLLSIVYYLLFFAVTYPPFVARMAASLSKKSFGIYFSHPFFLGISAPVIRHVFNPEPHYILYMISVFACTLTACLLWESVLGWLGSVFSRLISKIKTTPAP